MNRTNVAYILEHAGFKIIDNNGHVKYYNAATGKTAMITNHPGDIPSGTLNNIWRQAGLDYLRNVKSVREADMEIDRQSRLPTAPAAPSTDVQLDRMLHRNHMTEGFRAQDGTLVFANEQENVLVTIGKDGRAEKQVFGNAEDAYAAFIEKYCENGGRAPVVRGGVEVMGRETIHIGNIGEVLEDAGHAGSVAGHGLKILGIVATTATICAMASRAEAATRDGRLSAKDRHEYGLFLTGQAATLFDPTVIGGEEALQHQYDSWAQTHIKDPQLREELRPVTLLDITGIKTPSKMDVLFSYLPDRPTAETTRLGLDGLVALKQQMKHEALVLGRDLIDNPLFLDPAQAWRRQQEQDALHGDEQAFLEQYKALDQHALDTYLAETMPEADRNKAFVLEQPTHIRPTSPPAPH